MSSALDTTRTLRVPLWDPDDMPGPYEKLDQLESYQMLCGYWQGELADERITTLKDLEEKEREWAHLQPAIPARRKTEAAHADAKRELKPELYDEIERLRRHAKRLEEEYERLERDAAKCSRIWGRYAGS